MLDGFEDGQGGASDEKTRDHRLMGELLGTLSELKSRYDTARLELAWATLQTLMQHIEKYEGTAATIEFAEKAGQMLAEEANDINVILNEDFKKKLN
jgi:hypothetical protein